MINNSYERDIRYIKAKTGVSESKAKRYYKINENNIKKTLKYIKKKIQSGEIVVKDSETSGVVYGNVSNSSTLYGMDKFNTPRGHGFAAERANHICDVLTGKNAKIVGDDNAKFGADRIVNNINIQSKYCESGSKCIQECFENGRLKYINTDGSPMQIEVPADKYDEAVMAMERRIRNGGVPGVRNSSEAKNIVRKGNFTYEQAKNIARAGTVESITFDAFNGAIISTTTFGLSATMTFAVSIWNGNDFDVALKSATYSGLKVGGTTFVTAIVSSQLSRAGLNSALVGSSEAIINMMGPKASAVLVNSLRSGTNIYGAAAMKSASKMLRGNIITGAVSAAALSSVDVVNIFKGKISGAQLFKNVTNTVSALAGGTAGWVGGVSAGATIGSVVPVVGTVIGGFVGGLVGSAVAGGTARGASNKLLSGFIEDDANKMVKIIQNEFVKMASDYLLNEKEATKVTDNLQNELNVSVLKNMFASSNREQFAHDLLIDLIEIEVKKRKKIKMPSPKEMQKGLKRVLEEIADNKN